MKTNRKQLALLEEVIVFPAGEIASEAQELELLLRNFNDLH